MAFRQCQKHGNTAGVTMSTKCLHNIQIITLLYRKSKYLVAKYTLD